MRLIKLTRSLLCTLFVIFAPPAHAAADVANTRHNLSISGPGTIKSPAAIDEICVFCHTPHNALPDGPLWNHTLSGQTYAPLYDSTTLAANPGQPTGSSLLCLSCHDGTVALGDLRNPPPANDMGGMQLLPGDRGYLGTDLSDDHPISFDYTAAVPGELADPAATGLPFEAGRVQCITCHDPHEADIDPFLRITTLADPGNPNVGQLCTACHVRAGVTWDWSTSSHATSTAVPTGATPWPERRVEWRGANVGQNSCLNCHDPHSAATAARLIKGIEENTCYLCHDGSVAATNIQAEMGLAFRHPVEVDNTTVHDAVKVENPLTMPLHVECADCHNPHAVAAAPPMVSFNPVSPSDPHATPPLANARIAGVSGLDVNGSFKAEIDFQYEL